jgi:hypothetical protein
MEKQQLTDYLAKQGKPTGEHAGDLQLWYNPDGDCVEYQTEQVAIVADRIDNYLTIYRSAETNAPIGFQLKDVSALMKKHQSSIKVQWKTQDQRLLSVSAILLAAIEDGFPFTIKRREGYQQALRNLAQKDDVVMAQ